MLCSPAFTPVANDAHEVADSGERVVPSGQKPPCLASAEKFGILPSSIHCFRRCGSIPSKPRTTSFCEYLEAPRRAVPEQAAAHIATPTAAIARDVTVFMEWAEL